MPQQIIPNEQDYIDNFLRREGFDPETGFKITPVPPAPTGPPEKMSNAEAEDLIGKWLDKEGFDPETGLSKAPPPAWPSPLGPQIRPAPAQIPTAAGWMGQPPQSSWSKLAGLTPSPMPEPPAPPPVTPIRGDFTLGPNMLAEWARDKPLVDVNAASRWGTNMAPSLPAGPQIPDELQLDPEAMASWGQGAPFMRSMTVDPKAAARWGTNQALFMGPKNPEFEPPPLQDQAGMRDIEIGVAQSVKEAAIDLARKAEQIHGRIPLASNKSLSEGMEEIGPQPEEIASRRSADSQTLQGVGGAPMALLGYGMVPGGAPASMAMHDFSKAAARGETPQEGLREGLYAGAKGAVMGKVLDKLGPYSPYVRVPANAAMMGADAWAEGGDLSDIISASVVGGALGGMHGWGETGRRSNLERHNIRASLLLEKERRSGTRNPKNPEYEYGAQRSIDYRQTGAPRDIRRAGAEPIPEGMTEGGLDPDTGEPLELEQDRIARVQSDREQMAENYFGRPWSELNNRERSNIDEEIAQGKGPVTGGRQAQPKERRPRPVPGGLDKRGRSIPLDPRRIDEVQAKREQLAQGRWGMPWSELPARERVEIDEELTGRRRPPVVAHPAARVQTSAPPQTPPAHPAAQWQAAPPDDQKIVDEWAKSREPKQRAVFTRDTAAQEFFNKNFEDLTPEEQKQIDTWIEQRAAKDQFGEKPPVQEVEPTEPPAEDEGQKFVRVQGQAMADGMDPDEATAHAKATLENDAEDFWRKAEPGTHYFHPGSGVHYFFDGRSLQTTDSDGSLTEGTKQYPVFRYSEKQLQERSQQPKGTKGAWERANHPEEFVGKGNAPYSIANSTGIETRGPQAEPKGTPVGQGLKAEPTVEPKPTTIDKNIEEIQRQHRGDDPAIDGLRDRVLGLYGQHPDLSGFGHGYDRTATPPPEIGQFVKDADALLKEMKEQGHKPRERDQRRNSQEELENELYWLKVRRDEAQKALDTHGQMNEIAARAKKAGFGIESAEDVEPGDTVEIFDHTSQQALGGNRRAVITSYTEEKPGSKKGLVGRYEGEDKETTLPSNLDLIRKVEEEPVTVDPDYVRQEEEARARREEEHRRQEEEEAEQEEEESHEPRPPRAPENFITVIAPDGGITIHETNGQAQQQVHVNDGPGHVRGQSWAFVDGEEFKSLYRIGHGPTGMPLPKVRDRYNLIAGHARRYYKIDAPDIKGGSRDSIINKTWKVIEQMREQAAKRWNEENAPQPADPGRELVKKESREPDEIIADWNKTIADAADDVRLQDRLRNQAPSWKQRGSDYANAFKEDVVDPLQRLLSKGKLDEFMRAGGETARLIDGWVARALMRGVRPEVAHQDLLDAGLPRKYADPQLRDAVKIAEFNLQSDRDPSPEERAIHERTLDYAQRVLGQPEVKSPTGRKRIEAPEPKGVGRDTLAKVKQALETADEYLKNGGDHNTAISALGGVTNGLKFIPEGLYPQFRERLIAAEKAIRERMAAELQPKIEPKKPLPQSKYQKGATVEWQYGRGKKKGTVISTPLEAGNRGKYHIHTGSELHAVDEAKILRTIEPEAKPEPKAEKAEPKTEEKDSLRPDDPREGDTMAQGDGKYTVVKSWRTATQKEPDGKLNVTLVDSEGKRFTLVGQELKGWVKEPEPKAEPETPGHISAADAIANWKNLKVGQIIDTPEGPMEIRRVTALNDRMSPRITVRDSAGKDSVPSKVYIESNWAKPPETKTPHPIHPNITPELIRAYAGLKNPIVNETYGEIIKKAHGKITEQQLHDYIRGNFEAGRVPPKEIARALKALAEAPKGWDSVQSTAPFERHPSVDLTDEELRARAANKPLDMPPGPGRQYVADAWKIVSRILPDLAKRVTRIEVMPPGREENARINVKTGVLTVNPKGPLTPESLWHELIHLDQPKAQGGRDALTPDQFNELELQARGGIEDALKRFEKLTAQPERLSLDFSKGNEQTALAAATEAFKQFVKKGVTQEEYNAGKESLDGLKGLVDDGVDYYKWDAIDESEATGKKVTARQLWDRHIAEEVERFRKAIGEELVSVEAEKKALRDRWEVFKAARDAKAATVEGNAVAAYTELHDAEKEQRYGRGQERAKATRRVKAAKAAIEAMDIDPEVKASLERQLAMARSNHYVYKWVPRVEAEATPEPKPRTIYDKPDGEVTMDDVDRMAYQDLPEGRPIGKAKYENGYRLLPQPRGNTLLQKFNPETWKWEDVEQGNASYIRGQFEKLAKEPILKDLEPEPTVEPKVEVKTPTGKKLSSKQKAAEAEAFRRDLFTPGNIIQEGYGGGRAKVLKYEENPEGLGGGYGTWRVTVQEVDKDGNLIGRVRTHSTTPSPKEDKVISRAEAAKPEPKPESGPRYEPVVLLEPNAENPNIKKLYGIADTWNYNEHISGTWSDEAEVNAALNRLNKNAGVRPERTLADDRKRLATLEKALAGETEPSDLMKERDLLRKKLGEAEPEGGLEKLDKAGREADERLRDKGVIRDKNFIDDETGTSSFEYDPEAWRDAAISMAGKIARGAMKFREFRDRMVKRFGEEVREYLPELWETAPDLDRLMGWPLDIRSATGGPPLTSDVGLAMEELTQKHFGKLGPETDAELRKARALERIASDFRALANLDRNGKDWYDAKVAATEEILRKHRPELKDPAKMALFKYVLAVTSNSVGVKVNALAGLKTWDLYHQQVRRNPGRPAEFPARNPATGKWVTRRGPSYETALSVLSTLVREKGEAGAVEWLKAMHPKSELAKYNPSQIGFQEPGIDRLGAYVLGPKVGSFGSNLNGIHDQLTMDKWWSRSWNRWMGTVMARDKRGRLITGEDGAIMLQETPRGVGERRLMRDVATQAAAKLGITVDELQAMLWYGEQRLYAAHGQNERSFAYDEVFREHFEPTEPRGRVRPQADAGNRGQNAGRGPAAVARTPQRGAQGIPEGLPEEGPRDARSARRVEGNPAARRRGERGASTLDFLTSFLPDRGKRSVGGFMESVGVPRPKEDIFKVPPEKPVEQEAQPLKQKAPPPKKKVQPHRKGELPFSEKSMIGQIMEKIKEEMAPSALSERSETAANLFREAGGEAKHRRRQSEVAMRDARRYFRGSYLVPKEFKEAAERAKNEERDMTDEERGLMGEGLRFIDRMEKGEAQEGDTPKVTEHLQAFAGAIRNVLDAKRDEIRGLGEGALREFMEHYFPHIWDRPDLARQIFLEHPRRFEGSKRFLKKRSIDSIAEGIQRGLKPAYDNPVDMIMAHIEEADKFIIARKVRKRLKELKLAKYVPEKYNGPAGWKTHDDPAFIHYGKATEEIREFNDALLTGRLNSFAGALDIPLSRETKKFKGHPAAAGLAMKGGGIRTQFGSPESVLAHEIGHQMEWKYELSKKLRARKIPGLERELRALADLRAEGFKPGSSYRKYIRGIDEKMANAAAALVYMPERFKEVAPELWDAFRDELYHVKDTGPDGKERFPLRPFVRDMEKSMVLGINTGQQEIKGTRVMGKYFMPPEVARVVKNYTSRGLGKHKLYRYWMNTANFLNQVQLLSLFHGGFVTLDAPQSKMALAIEHGSRAIEERSRGNREAAWGHLKEAGKSGLSAASILHSPFQYMSRGHQIVKAYESGGPGSEIDPFAWQKGRFAQHLPKSVRNWIQADPTQIKQNIRNMEISGGATQMSGIYATRMADKFVDAMKKHEWGKAALRLVPAISDQLMKPIMEKMVPRMKAGALADITNMEQKRLDNLDRKWQEISEDYVNEDGTYNLESIAQDPRLDNKGKFEIEKLMERIAEKKRTAFSEPFSVSPELRRKVMALAQNSIDNRMGQMEYDNKFINRLVKDALHAGVRSVGWNGGTIGEHGGGIVDLLRTRKRIKEGDPFITHRTAYVFATPIINGLIGGLMTQLMTMNHEDSEKRGIKEMKDLFFPRTGNTDEYGRDERLSLPTYLKDWAHLYYAMMDKDPQGFLKMVTSKLNPLPTAAIELARNRNYYDEELYKTDGPYHEQALSFLKAVLKEMEPFASRGYRKEVERGGDMRKKLLPIIGVTPAVKATNESPFERYMDRHTGGFFSGEAKTEEQAAHGKALREITRAIRKGEGLMELKDRMQKHIDAGDLVPEDYQKAKQRAEKDPYEASFGYLRDYSTVIEAMKQASPEERAQVKDAFIRKIGNLSKQSPNLMNDARRKIEEAGLTYLFE